MKWNPDLDILYNERGFYKEKLNLFQSALEDYDLAISMNESSLNAYFNRAVLNWNILSSQEKADIKSVSFDELLLKSDFVSIHAPHTKDTTNLFNAKIFKKMKSSALLINTARGPLVNTDELAVALDEGEIGGAALDVVPIEPLPKDSPLLGRDNVILTPHTAFYSEDALLDLQRKCAEDVASVLREKTPIYPINPEVLA